MGLVPPGNFYHRLEAMLDLSSVRDWVMQVDADRGRPSIDPVVFFTLQLLMVFDGIRSERNWSRQPVSPLPTADSLGYALDENLPRIRQRLGIDLFQRFFEKVVDLCQGAGFVWGRELYVDATKVEANADVDSLTPRVHHNAKAHIADLFAAGPASNEHDDVADTPPGDDVVSGEGVVHLLP